MAISSGAIRLGCCYATWGGDMRKILEIRGEEVTYVVRGKLAFPSWDRKLWRSTTRDAFAREVKAQVPCDRRGE
jgi:hypothetical protein